MKNVVTVNRKCPACGGDKAEKLHRMEMLLPEEFRIKGEYDIVSCAKCGNCFGDTTSTEGDYDYYYSNHNHYGGWQGNSSSSYDINVIKRVINRVVCKDASIIDIGFGNGKLLCDLKESGFTNLRGIDPSEESVKALRKLGISGEVGSIYDKKDEYQKTDLAIFTMVLEHLLSPRKAIASIAENLLKEDGFIVVTWPYFDDLVADGSPIVNNFNHEHINYFSEKTADILFSGLGFTKMEHHVSLGVSKGEALQFSNIALYKKDGARSSEPIADIEKDTATKESICEYVGRLSQREREVFGLIENLADGKENIVIWGAGGYLFYLLKSSKIGKCNISYIVDNNKSKQGMKLFEYEIKSPEALRKFKGTVVVTAMLYGKEIQEQIKSFDNNELKVIMAF